MKKITYRSWALNWEYSGDKVTMPHDSLILGQKCDPFATQTTVWDVIFSNLNQQFSFILGVLVPFDTSWLRIPIEFLVARSTFHSVLLAALPGCFLYYLFPFATNIWEQEKKRQDTVFTVVCEPSSCGVLMILVTGFFEEGSEGKGDVFCNLRIQGPCWFTLMAGFLWAGNSKFLFPSFAVLFSERQQMNGHGEITCQQDG